ncbi:hypothetical protein HPB49_019722 [Dermacentor silvarum]|uniref:Uncharacterized protein n=1 Tax=Dermacentor silvarum TaxID=543639 RepID=A0ACB8E2J7_DERSI|nr:hypothetical protein HPB49_019722 [Dermacentor silvarum]
MRCSCVSISAPQSLHLVHIPVSWKRLRYTYESAQCPCPRLEQEAASNAVIIKALRTDTGLVSPVEFKGGLRLHFLAPDGGFSFLYASADLDGPLGCSVGRDFFTKEAVLLLDLLHSACPVGSHACRREILENSVSPLRAWQGEEMATVGARRFSGLEARPSHISLHGLIGYLAMASKSSAPSLPLLTLQPLSCWW